MVGGYPTACWVKEVVSKELVLLEEGEMMVHYIPCPYCGGTGKVKHTCEERDLELLKRIWEMNGSTWGESLGIYRCRICGQLWKIRWQWDSGTGCDNIWLRPGESERGYTFTHEEAEEVLASV